MIDVNLFFKNISLEDVILCLEKLPNSIRPVYFSEDEHKINDENDLISNTDRFNKFKDENELGFFLFSQEKTLIDISISSPVINYSEVSVEIDYNDIALVETFFNALEPCKPSFGFACEWGEFKYRNRHYAKFGENNIESWIGRQLSRYLSGLYWYTLVSSEILDTHNVPLSDLSKEALSHEKISENLHLLKFYDQSADWQEHKEKIDDLCERITGIFSRRSVERALEGVTQYLEYDEIISNWR